MLKKFIKKQLEVNNVKYLLCLLIIFGISQKGYNQIIKDTIVYNEDLVYYYNQANIYVNEIKKRNYDDVFLIDLLNATNEDKVNFQSRMKLAKNHLKGQKKVKPLDCRFVIDNIIVDSLNTQFLTLYIPIKNNYNLIFKFNFQTREVLSFLLYASINEIEQDEMFQNIIKEIEK